jgi:hypothetical protein
LFGGFEIEKVSDEANRSHFVQVDMHVFGVLRFAADEFDLSDSAESIFSGDERRKDVAHGPVRSC